MKSEKGLLKLCVKTTVLCTLATGRARQPVCTPDTALTLLLLLPKVRLEPDDDEGGGRQVPEEGVEGVHQDDQRLMHIRASGLKASILLMNFIFIVILCFSRQMQR